MLDTLSTRVKYAIIGCVGITTGWFISRALLEDVSGTWWSSALAGAVGGYIGGWIKERRNRS